MYRAWWIWLLVMAPLGLAKETDAILMQLWDRDPVRRARAADLLGDRRGVAVSLALESALTDPAPRVQHSAAASLARVRPETKGIVPILVRSLRNPDWYVRWQACLALKRVGKRARDAVPALLDTLCDPNVDTCREATLAITAIARDDPRVVRKLHKLYARGLGADRSAIYYALYGPIPIEVRRVHWQMNLLARGSAPEREHSAKLFAELIHPLSADRAVGDALAAACADPSLRVRNAARQALYLHARRSRRHARQQLIREDIRQALALCDARELTRDLPTWPHAVLGYLHPEHGQYGILRTRLQQQTLSPRTVEVLGLLIWDDPDYGRDVLAYGGSDLRSLALGLLPHVELDSHYAISLTERLCQDESLAVRDVAQATLTTLRQRAKR